MRKFALIPKWLRLARRDTVAAYYAVRDPRTPLAARLAGIAIAAYALSPVDLVPDFVPLLGYVDDLTVVAAGASFILRRLAPGLQADCIERANRFLARAKAGASTTLVIILALLAVSTLAWWLH